MTTVTIAPENPDTGKNIWRAIAGDKQSIGETAGEALDALTSQLGESEGSSVVVIRRWEREGIFTLEQQERLRELMDRWRKARDSGDSLSTEEQAELAALVEAELIASAQRKEKALAALKRIERLREGLPTVDAVAIVREMREAQEL
jgi:hypothetical protein